MRALIITTITIAILWFWVEYWPFEGAPLNQPGPVNVGGFGAFVN